MANDVSDVRPASLIASQSTASAPFSSLRTALEFSGAILCLVLAALGFFLPLLPCTPFVLLASVLLVRSSPGTHRRLRSSRFFGRILADWEDRKGIRAQDKVRAVIVVVAGLLFSMYVGNPTPMLRFLILFFVTIGLWVICRLPTAKDLDSAGNDGVSKTPEPGSSVAKEILRNHAGLQDRQHTAVPDTHIRHAGGAKPVSYTPPNSSS